MKLTRTYRFIASVLCLTIFFGVSIPAGLHAKSQEECDAMEKMHKQHVQVMTEASSVSEHAMPMEGHCPTKIQSATKPAPVMHKMLSESRQHDFGFACACNIDEAPVKTESKTLEKNKVPVLNLIKVLAELHINEPETEERPVYFSESYSPPPIYLANASFLN